MKSEIELNSCSEDGHKPVIRKDDFGYYVRCIVDFCDNCTEYFDTPEEAAEEWNRRNSNAK